MIDEPLYVAILAGGVGTRLWPISRKERPKFLIELDDGLTLLARTIERALQLAPASNICIVTTAAYESKVRVVGAKAGVGHYFIEPEGRDTSASLTFANARIAGLADDPIVISMPADQLIDDRENSFFEAMKTAVLVAREGQIACLGVVPTNAETAYGYLHAPNALLLQPALISEFHEKPDAATAARYFEAKTFFWNTAVMSWRSSVFANTMAACAPSVFSSVVEAMDTPMHVNPALWMAVPQEAIERSLMQPAAAMGKVSLVPADLVFADLGLWSAFADSGQLQTSGNLLGTVGARAPYVHVSAMSSSRKYAIVGVDDLIIVDAGDVTLITNRQNAPLVKLLVENLRSEAGAQTFL